jgi:hypothetical protein
MAKSLHKQVHRTCMVQCQLLVGDEQLLSGYQVDSTLFRPTLIPDTSLVPR